MWWAMGGMSLSLLEQVRRAGVPAVAVVGDEWLGYGPRSTGGRGTGAVPAPAGGARGRALSGVPDPAGARPGGARGSFNSAYTRSVACAAGWRLADATVDHPGVDPERFGPVDRHRAWAWRLLYCGRIDPRKGIDTAMRALTLLPDEARLVVDGTGDPDHAGRAHARWPASSAERPRHVHRLGPPEGAGGATPPAMRWCSR